MSPANAGPYLALILPSVGGTPREPARVLMRLYPVGRPLQARATARRLSRGDVPPGAPVYSTIILTAGADTWLWWTSATRAPVWATPYWEKDSLRRFRGCVVLLATRPETSGRDLERVLRDLRRRFGAAMRVDLLGGVEDATTRV